jgi:hypothetical protein
MQARGSSVKPARLCGLVRVADTQGLPRASIVRRFAAPRLDPCALEASVLEHNSSFLPLCACRGIGSLDTIPLRCDTRLCCSSTHSELTIFPKVPQFGCEARAQYILHIVPDLFLPRAGVLARGQQSCLSVVEVRLDALVAFGSRADSTRQPNMKT